MNIELCLLSKMLQEGDFGPILRGEITEEHFGTTEGKVLYGFITNYRKETGGKAIFPSLKIVKRRFDHIELPELDEADTVEALAHETVQQKYRADLRAFAAECEQIANSADPPMERVLPLFARFRKSAEIVQRRDHVSLAEGLHNFVNRYGTGEVIEQGIPYPWPTLNSASRGMHKGEFIIVAGRPKSRKTFTALRIGTHAVKHHHARVLVFSSEMSPQAMFMRCVAHFCDLPYSELKKGELAEAEEMRLFEAARDFGRLQEMTDENYAFHLKTRIPGLGSAVPSLDIVKSGGKDTAWMAAQIELHRPDIVIADSFYRQRAVSARKNDVDYKAITMLSRELKDLAMETNTVIVGTHQLNRDAQHSVGDINNLAFADALGADCDVAYRVITGKTGDAETSAIIGYAAREFAFEGILIRNNPCYDYSEIGPISNKRQVLDLMKQEEQEAEREESRRLRELASPGSGGEASGAVERRLTRGGAAAREARAEKHREATKENSRKRNKFTGPRFDDDDEAPGEEEAS